MVYRHQRLVFIISLCMFISLLVISSSWAQAYPPGFDFRMEWEHYEEQSKDRKEVNVTNIGARVGYSFPQVLDLYIGLSWEDMDARLPDPNSSAVKNFDLDPALAFKVGAKAYVLRNIPMGVPGDFSVAFSYNTAKHKEDGTDLEFTHHRIIGTGCLEWNYMRSVPYLKLGVLYSKLDAGVEGYKDKNQTSLLFAGGVYLKLMDYVYLRTEVNWCQEIGYVLGVQYRF